MLNSHIVEEEPLFFLGNEVGDIKKRGNIPNPPTLHAATYGLLLLFFHHLYFTHSLPPPTTRLNNSATTTDDGMGWENSDCVRLEGGTENSAQLDWVPGLLLN